MIYTMDTVTPERFAQSYGLWDTTDELHRVCEKMSSLEAMYGNQNTGDRQAWLDSWAHIVHRTSQRHKGDPVIFTTDADEFLAWADALLAEVTS